MKRKVIQLAGKTLVVSLPSKWARDSGIKKGDEVDVEQSAGMITISSKSSAKPDKVSIDVTGLNCSLIWYYLTSAYRKGANEIEVSYSAMAEDPKTGEKQKTMSVISNIVDGLIGVEIVRQGRDYCVIREISEVKAEEFGNMLRKLFLLVVSLAEDLAESVKDSDKERLGNLQYIEKNVNKLTFFCQRILARTSAIDRFVYFYILSQIEEIADCYACFSEHIGSVKWSPLFGELAVLSRMFYEAFYSTDKSRLSAFYAKRDSIKKSIKSVKEVSVRESLAVFCKQSDIMMAVLNAKLMAEV